MTIQESVIYDIESKLYGLGRAPNATAILKATSDDVFYVVVAFMHWYTGKHSVRNAVVEYALNYVT
jgi:hypothetical protein